MIKVKFDFNKVEKRFRELGKRAERPKRGMEVLAVMGWRDVQRHFEKQSTPKGKRWQGWKDPKTGKRVNTRPYPPGGNKLLLDTGFLRNATGWRIEKKDAVIYNDTVYARRQHGMRAFMGLSKKVKKEMSKALMNFIIRGKKV